MDFLRPCPSKWRKIKSNVTTGFHISEIIPTFSKLSVIKADTLKSKTDKRATCKIKKLKIQFPNVSPCLHFMYIRQKHESCLEKLNEPVPPSCYCWGRLTTARSPLSHLYYTQTDTSRLQPGDDGPRRSVIHLPHSAPGGTQSSTHFQLLF